MVTLELHFLTGRYHATAWGSQVNEGIVEWPPSPWRLLRGLISAFYLKNAEGSVSEIAIRQLVDQLASVLPSYRLPPYYSGHTRHYMPIAGDKTTKVFDAFFHVPQGERLYVFWPVELTEETRSAFEILTSRWNYLGRSESLVEAKLTSESNSEENSLQPNATPVGSDVGRDANLVKLLAPLSDDGYLEWKAREPEQKAIAVNLFQALQVDTHVFRKAGWSQPPGSQWVHYAVQEQKESTYFPKHMQRSASLPHVARFAVVSDVSPSVSQALSLGERLHRTLVSYSAGYPLFSGRDPDTREPLRDHRHAYYLSESNNHRATIDFITVYAKQGIDDEARRSLEKVRGTWGYEGHDVQMVLLGLGQPEDFGGLKAEAGQCLILAESRTWISLTPFVPTRHPKFKSSGQARLDPQNGLHIGSPEHDLLRLAALQGLPEVASFQARPEGCKVGKRDIPCLRFQRQRKVGEGRKAGSFGYAFVLNFKEPVRGPLAFGYGSHFGLGLFVPASGEEN